MGASAGCGVIEQDPVLAGRAILKAGGTRGHLANLATTTLSRPSTGPLRTATG